MVNLLVIFFLNVVFAQSLKIIGYVDIPGDKKIQETTVGGLSGAVFYKDELIVVSDDKGKVDDPRAYRFAVSLSDNKKQKSDLAFQVRELGVINFEQQKKITYDFEGLSVLPWGTLLVSTEGDNNKKPRQGPELKEFKLEGSFIRDYSVPEEIVPNPSGKLKKGILNNHGLEGLTAVGADQWLIMVERALKQDSEQMIRAFMYKSKEAWKIELVESLTYELEPNLNSHLKWGVSEVFWLRDNRFIVIERGVLMESPLSFDAQLFLVEKEAGKLVKKKQLLSSAKEPLLALNFETIARGPVYNGKETIILISDNDFRVGSPSRFVLLSVEN